MSETTVVDELPFHEYCAGRNQRFDATVLDPVVRLVDTDDGRVLHSFCDEECVSEQANEQ